MSFLVGIVLGLGIPALFVFFVFGETRPVSMLKRPRDRKTRDAEGGSLPDAMADGLDNPDSHPAHGHPNSGHDASSDLHHPRGSSADSGSSTGSSNDGGRTSHSGGTTHVASSHDGSSSGDGGGSSHDSGSRHDAGSSHDGGSSDGGGFDGGGHHGHH